MTEKTRPGTPSLVLASSSPYRRELMQRLQLPFTTASPDVDETPALNESAEALASRLAEAKALTLAHRFSHHLIVGCDQVAQGPDGTLLGKPGNRENARQQLHQFSGRSVRFFTGLCLHHSGIRETRHHLETYQVHFRDLNARNIEYYLDLEQPFDCAGSFRMEGLGIALFDRLEGRDPNTLIGLPLIALIDALAAFGVHVLAPGTFPEAPQGNAD